jgi:mRNA-degrading endonuclease RelE of RelBE toxin-antitoxin system
MSYEIVLTDTIKVAVRRLKKRYRHVVDDLEIAVNVLQERPELGKVIVGGHGVRKVRIANRDARRGKSGGYRVLYYLVDKLRKLLYLLFIYAKSDREDVDTKEIEQLLKQTRLW